MSVEVGDVVIANAKDWASGHRRTLAFIIARVRNDLKLVVEMIDVNGTVFVVSEWDGWTPDYYEIISRVKT